MLEHHATSESEDAPVTAQSAQVALDVALKAAEGLRLELLKAKQRKERRKLDSGKAQSFSTVQPAMRGRISDHVLET